MLLSVATLACGTPNIDDDDVVAAGGADAANQSMPTVDAGPTEEADTDAAPGPETDAAVPIEPECLLDESPLIQGWTYVFGFVQMEWSQ